MRVDTDGAQVRFAVVDDGAGFDPGPADVGKGQGFVNMRDRIGALSGTLEVSSVPGEGTTVWGRLPATALDGDA